MSFVDRRKRAHLWRENPDPTPEQVVTGVVRDIAVGVASSFARKVIEKAFRKFGIGVPDSVVAADDELPKSPPKKKAKAKAKAKTK